MTVAFTAGRGDETRTEDGGITVEVISYTCLHPRRPCLATSEMSSVLPKVFWLIPSADEPLHTMSECRMLAISLGMEAAPTSPRKKVRSTMPLGMACSLAGSSSRRPTRTAWRGCTSCTCSVSISCACSCSASTCFRSVSVRTSGKKKTSPL